ncbi:hypothetical protein [Paractinoplanes hotanensis]|uniref:Uncharacterized protein n=1 Tax=Paractinoplanes hotanensis TaxID=2906497 RepID=A0ABT0YDK7_9ACTN|nr:hypothetical protein [Actinoplanes hotanensis]MCM4084134.1 hypothetical protein [Actinoplanes hotanensis]
MTETDVERRLREALSARAAAVTARDLRPDPAPSGSARRSRVTRWWLPLTAGLAAAAVSIMAFVLLRPVGPAPAPPVSPASPASPASSPAASPPSSPAATPSASPFVSPPAPSRSPARGGSTPASSAPSRTVAPTPR